MGLYENERERNAKAYSQTAGVDRSKLTRIKGTAGGEWYYDELGNVYASKAGGLIKATDPWTKRYKGIAQQNQFNRDLSVYDTEQNRHRSNHQANVEQIFHGRNL